MTKPLQKRCCGKKATGLKNSSMPLGAILREKKHNNDTLPSEHVAKEEVCYACMMLQ